MLRSLEQTCLAAAADGAGAYEDLEARVVGWVGRGEDVPPHLHAGPLKLPRERGYRTDPGRHAELRRRVYHAVKALEGRGYIIKVQDPQVDDLDELGRIIIEWRYEPAPALWANLDWGRAERVHYSPRAGGYVEDLGTPIPWKWLAATEADAVRRVGL